MVISDPLEKKQFVFMPQCYNIENGKQDTCTEQRVPRYL